MFSHTPLWLCACCSRSALACLSRALACSRVLALNMEWDDMVFPDAVIRSADGSKPPSRNRGDFDAALHGALPATDEDCDDPFAVQMERAAAQHHDGRGRYDRSDGVGSRSAWIPHVQRHMEAINTGNLASIIANPKLACSKDCPQHGRCMEDVGIRVLKVCAAESFGEAALEQLWDSITPNHTAVATWFELARSGRIVNEAGTVAVLYKIGDSLVCAPAWAAVRGIPPTTAAAIDRAVRAGANTWNDGTQRAAASAERSLRGPLKAAATAWWMTRLGYYEMITTRGLILHPRGMVWDAVYDDEFVAEMRLLGHAWRLRSEAKGDGYGSQGTWYLGRAEALQRLAHQKLGAGTKAFKFVSRAKHSAYKECHDCQTKRLAKAAAIARGAPPDEIKALDADLTTHLQWMYAQRLRLEQITQMAGHEVTS